MMPAKRVDLVVGVIAHADEMGRSLQIKTRVYETGAIYEQAWLRMPFARRGEYPSVGVPVP